MATINTTRHLMPNYGSFTIYLPEGSFFCGLELPGGATPNEAMAIFGRREDAAAYTNWEARLLTTSPSEALVCERGEVAKCLGIWQHNGHTRIGWLIEAEKGI